MLQCHWAVFSLWLCLQWVLIASQDTPKYLITMPKKLLLGGNHTVTVEVSQAPTELRISSTESDFTQIYQLNSKSGVISLQIPPNLTGDVLNLNFQLFGNANSQIFSTPVSLPIVRHKVFIISETSKPIYKPGETVQFRFLPVFLPDLQVPRDTPFSFIKIEDPDNTLVFQEANVTWKSAMNLSYELQEDTKLGEWRLSAAIPTDSGEETEERVFQVRKYVLPKFTVEVKAAEKVWRGATQFPVEVCVKSGIGKTLKGVIHIVSTFLPSSSFTDTVRKTKTQKSDVLRRSEMCHKMNVSLPAQELLSLYTNSELEVVFTEEGTGETVTKNEAGPRLVDEPYSVDIEGRDYFKGGLPYYFTVKWRGLELLKQTITSPSGYALRLKVESNGNNLIDKIVSPNQNAEYHGKVVSFDADSPLTVSVKAEKAAEDLATQTKRVEPWKSGGKVLQIAPVHDFDVKCHPKGGQRVSVKVSVQTNFPLHHTDLKGQYLQRGVLHEAEIKTARSAPKVSSRNNQTPYVEQTITIDILDKSVDVHLLLFTTVDGEIVADQVELPKIKECLETTILKKNKEDFHFSKAKTSPGSNITLTLSPPSYQESHCGLRISDVTLENFGNAGGLSLRSLVNKLFDFYHDLTTNGGGESRLLKKLRTQICEKKKEKEDFRDYLTIPAVSDSGKIFEDAGLLVITNFRYLHHECLFQQPIWYFRNRLYGPPEGMGFDGRTGGFGMGATGGGFGMGATGGGFEAIGGGVFPRAEAVKKEIKARIREYFPETWRYDYIVQPQTPKIDLTVPDSITTWNADAYCVTPGGLWTGRTLTLTVAMPFFVEPTLPYSVKKGETLLIPVKVTSYMSGCLQVQITVSLPSGHLRLVDSTASQFTMCMCGENAQTTELIRVRAVTAGKGKIEIHARSSAASSCVANSSTGSVDFNNDAVVAVDAVKRDLLVEHEGIPTETTFSELLCLPPSPMWSNHSFTWHGDRMVAGSLRVYLQYGADLIGPTMNNLGQLIHMPYGCGEQNMISMVPSIYVLDYFMETGASDKTVMDSAKRYIVVGYHRELKYQHDDGSFSAFGGSGDSFGSTWLTAFVIRSFLDAKKHVPDVVSDSVIKEAQQFLLSMQGGDGCFVENGTVLDKGMKGALQNNKKLEPVLMTAYILTSLSDTDKSVVKRGFACLEKFLNKTETYEMVELSTLDTYTLALISYAYSSHSTYDPVVYQHLTSDLWSRRVPDGMNKLYFTHRFQRETKPSVETTAYAYLALENRPDFMPIDERMKLIRWLNSQRNSMGGMESTQDTILALKAISRFSTQFSKFQFRQLNLKLSGTAVDPNLRKADLITPQFKLVTKKWRVPMKINSNTTEHPLRTFVLAEGSGCFFLQSIFMYNKIPHGKASSQSLQLSQRSLQVSSDCKSQVILVCMSWNGKPQDSGAMFLLQVKPLSGWIVTQADPWNNGTENRPKLQEIRDNTWNYYFDGFTHEVQQRCLRINFFQNVFVENSKPSSMIAIDYYHPEVKQEILYTFPSCEAAVTVRP